jgi:serine/threonine protein kinase
MVDDGQLRNKQQDGQDGPALPSATTTAESSNGNGTDPLIGTILSEKYRILEQIGSGGMSVVYKARDELLNRPVAIKFLAGNVDPQSLARFQREGIAACRLDDPHVINIHELNLSPDLKPYLVMDYVEGEPLSSLLGREAPLPLSRALGIITQIAEALDHAHSRGIIHRDIKPSNIILARNAQNRDFVKLLDFGIAKLKTTEMEMQGLTKTGEVFGSPLYMSPEQCLGREVDARGDIYSLACMFYEMLSGNPPLVGDNCFQTMRKHTDEKPITLSQIDLANDVPPAVENIVMRCLEKDPEARYQTVQELLDALTQAAKPAPTPRPIAPSRVRVVTAPTTSHRGTAINLAAGVAIGALATAGVLYHQYHSMPSPVVTSQSTPPTQMAPAPSSSPDKQTRRTDVKSPDHSHEHSAKTIPIVKPAEAATKPIEKHPVKVATALLPVVAPPEKAKPKPKASHDGFAYLPPPESKTTAARNIKSAVPKGKPNLNAELKKAQLQDQVDRTLNQVEKEAGQENYSGAEGDLIKLLPSAASLYGVQSDKYAATLENLETKATRNEDYGYAQKVAAQAMQINTGLHGADCNQNARILAWLGLIKFKTNDQQQAGRLYDQAMGICHKNHWLPPWIALRCGQFQVHVKNYKKAETIYQEGLKSDVGPRDITARKKLFAELENLYKTMKKPAWVKTVEKAKLRYLQSVQAAD